MRTPCPGTGTVASKIPSGTTPATTGISSGPPATIGTVGRHLGTFIPKAELGLRYNDLTLYTEGATGSVGAFVEMSYRAIDPVLAAPASNFGDMNVGTKMLLFDCERLQLGFLFRTFIPSGNFIRGLGDGHVSLEPSVVLAVKLTQDSYLQAQLAEWIPIGGDPDYEGSILHYHMSLNQVLCRILADVALIGTCELNTWSFQAGRFTDPLLGSFQKASDETYVSVGGGIRLFICDRIDFGVAAAFSVTEHHWAEQLYRSEFRWRF